jgi:hypothetical protein
MGLRGCIEDVKQIIPLPCLGHRARRLSQYVLSIWNLFKFWKGKQKWIAVDFLNQCFCGLVTRVPGTRSTGLGSISGPTRSSEK